MELARETGVFDLEAAIGDCVDAGFVCDGDRLVAVEPEPVVDRRAAEAVAVPLGSVTVREWPLKRSDIRRYTGSKARRQKAALEEFGFGESGDDTSGVKEADIKRKEIEGVFILRDGYVKFVPVTIGILVPEGVGVDVGVAVIAIGGTTVAGRAVVAPVIQ